MHKEFVLLEIDIPTYSLFAITGVVISFIIGLLICWIKKIDIYYYLKMFLWGGIAAIIGAKTLTLLEQAVISEDFTLTIQRFTDAGYSVFGGLLTGTAAIIVIAKYYDINLDLYFKNLTFLVPLLHAIWKIGCYMGGCCYGINYSGPLAIVYPEGVPAPAGELLFPVQLLESGILFLLSIVFFYMGIKNVSHILGKYISCYALIRFLLEYLRSRNVILIFSMAQWISIFLMACIICILIINKLKTGETKHE